MKSKSPSPKPSGKLRLSLDVAPEIKDQLEDLQQRSRATTLVEVFRRSLALYDLVLDHIAHQGSIVLESADGTKEKLRIL